MEKTKEKCVLDEMRIKLLRFFIELTEDELREAQETYSVPERKSPLAKYEIKEQLDEKCVAADGRSLISLPYRLCTSGCRWYYMRSYSYCSHSFLTEMGGLR